MDGASGRKVQEYSFPVLTGISASDPLSTRAARMKIYMEFVAALDAGGENISRGLSEVDLSNPEDVKAILPSGGSASTDVLVHFGDAKFLERYHQYRQHLAEWRTQYPRLGSVDMRYERQVVLEMQPGGAAVPAAAASDVKPAEKKAEPVVAKAAAKPVAVKSVAVKPAVVAKPVAAKVKAPAVASHPVAVAAVPPAPVHHLTKAFDVGPRAKAVVATPVAQGAAR
jgi:cell division protein FtsQ